MKSYQHLLKLMNLDGISGREIYITNYLEEQFKKLGLEIIRDNLGSVFGFKKSKIKDAPSVMIDAHTDEVGFFATSFEKDGFIMVDSPNGIWDLNLLAQRVRLTTRCGKVIRGTISTVAPHLLTRETINKPIKLVDMKFDFGFKNIDEIKKAGICLGDQITFDAEAIELNSKRVLGKAADNRAGLAITLNVVSKLIREDLPFDLYVGGSVQEESGLRGARTSATLIKPDFAVIVDVSPETASATIGNGTLIRYLDAAHITKKNVIDWQLGIAKENNIKTQAYVSKGATNAGIISLMNDGTPLVQVCLAARNLHSASSIIDLEDVKNTEKMLGCILASLNSKIINKLKEW